MNPTICKSLTALKTNFVSESAGFLNTQQVSVVKVVVINMTRFKQELTNKQKKKAAN